MQLSITKSWNINLTQALWKISKIELLCITIIWVVVLSFSVCSAIAEDATTQPDNNTQTKANYPLAPSPLHQYANNVLRGLLIIFILLVAGARLYKKQLLKHEKPEERIKITSRKTISPKVQLIIAKIDEEEFLLTLNQEGLSLLSKLESKNTYCSTLNAQAFDSQVCSTYNFSEELKHQESALAINNNTEPAPMTETFPTKAA